jgi:hypothetical protein
MTKVHFCSGVSTGGDEEGCVPKILRRGRPCICPPRFHSAIIVDIPLGRYRAIEYSATFDDSIGLDLYKVYIQFNG